MAKRYRKLRKLSLRKALNIGYLRNEAKQAKRLKAFSYILDPELTTGNYLTAYSPRKNKVIFVDNGTNPTSIKDLYTDLAGIGLSRLQSTSRYKQDYTAYLKAKEKYKDAPITLVGHSLGGAIVTNLVKPDDRAIVYNAANTIFTKKKDNVTSYRTQGDLFSAFDLQAKTLRNAGSIFTPINPIQPHNLSNLGDKPIFV